MNTGRGLDGAVSVRGRVIVYGRRSFVRPPFGVAFNSAMRDGLTDVDAYCFSVDWDAATFGLPFDAK